MGRNMRIISQDGMLDVPYEKVSIEICDKRIFAISAEGSANPRLMAEYKLNDDAMLALHMLHRQYIAQLYNKGASSCWKFPSMEFMRRRKEDNE